MSIPLVQNNEKDSINTSIIAIKKNLERINSILGLVDSGSDIDTSEFVKKSDIVDVVQSGNMNPVTSNAVVPVDTVTSGNMHSVTSNAVAKTLVPSSTTIIESTSKRRVSLTGGTTSWWGMGSYPPPSVPSGKRLIRTFARCSNGSTGVSICNYGDNNLGVLTVCDTSGTYDIWLCIEVADL